MNKITYILLLLAGCFFVACSSEDIPTEQPQDKATIGLQLAVSNFVGESTIRAGFDATSEEKTIDNVYLFVQTATTLHKYYADGATFNGGTWDKTAGKIMLALTPAQAGLCDVYVVANAGAGTLDGIGSIAELKAKTIEKSNPWSGHIAAPLIMSGSVMAHNFATTPVLNTVPLTRAVAKVEIAVKLSAQYQSAPTLTNPHTNEVVLQYNHRLLNFDKHTYLLKPANKGNDLTSSGWNNWSSNSSDGLTQYETGNDGKVKQLTLVTYLNERDAGDPVTLMVQLPFWDEGMPPPQFLDEALPVVLPAVIKRNHYYKVAVQM